MRGKHRFTFVIGLILLGLQIVPVAGRQLPREDAGFEALWRRTDGRRAADASWLWGPRPWWQTQERYQQSSKQLRWVRYYDKTRMEVTDPLLPPASEWFVTNGLLVAEMVSGAVQTGDNERQSACATPPCGATQFVAGDAVAQNRSPRYVDFAPFSSLSGQRGANTIGKPVDLWLQRDEAGNPVVYGDGSLAERYPETVGATYDETTGQTIPQALSDFMQRQPLSRMYLFGHPITPAFWTHTLVGGVERDVLVQLFERRSLTYTPSNDPAWRVEMGNVGQHYVAWRYGSRPWDTTAQFGVTMLTYHYISVNTNPADTLRTALSVTPENLEAQIIWLRDHGYTSVSPDEILAAQRGELSLPAKPVLLTFDDGYEDFYLNAMPILQRYQFKGTFYVISDFVGRSGYVSWQQLREIAASPLITVGSHTRVHQPLDALTAERQQDEIVNSKAILEQSLGIPITHFCSPYGRYNATTLELLHSAGYQSATTTKPNLVEAFHDPFVWSRTSISGNDTLDDFAAKVLALQP